MFLKICLPGNSRIPGSPNGPIRHLLEIRIFIMKKCHCNTYKTVSRLIIYRFFYLGKFALLRFFEVRILISLYYVFQVISNQNDIFDIYRHYTNTVRSHQGSYLRSLCRYIIYVCGLSVVGSTELSARNPAVTIIIIDQLFSTTSREVYSESNGSRVFTMSIIADRDLNPSKS